MKELCDFASNSPFLTFFLVLIILQFLTWPFRLVNRWIRHRNVVAAGWPPFHLDADGDTRDFDEDDIEALKAGAANRSSTPQGLQKVPND